MIGGWWRRALEAVFKVHDTPHRTALAFGIGLWLAFSPLLGLHTVLALAIAFAFRLSRAAMLLGVYVNNPWTLAPMYLAGTSLGCMLLGVEADHLQEIDWKGSGREFYRGLLEAFRPYLWPYVVGNTVLGVLSGAAGYWIMKRLLERRQAARGGVQ
jgi:uncharacterized protein (DUF2062 family)